MAVEYGLLGYFVVPISFPFHSINRGATEDYDSRNTLHCCASSLYQICPAQLSRRTGGRPDPVEPFTWPETSSAPDVTGVTEG